MENSQQTNKNYENMSGYDDIQVSRINMEDELERGEKRLAALQDESEMDDISSYCISSSSNPNPADTANQGNGRIRDAEEIDPHGTISITNSNTLNNNYQEDEANQ